MAYNRTLKGRYRTARYTAHKRGISFQIFFDDYCDLVEPNVCEYCEGPLPPSGGALDRVDTSLPYTLENVVPCCHSCNSIKGEHLSYEEAKAAISAVYGLRDAKKKRGPK